MRFILIGISFCVIFFISPLRAQEGEIVRLLDSLYWEGDFKQIETLAEKNLITDKELYDEVGIYYYLGNAKYRLGNFKEALQLTEENYIRSKKLSFSDSLSVRIAIDACQKLGDYSYQAEKYVQGIDALKRGIEINEKHLDNDDWRLAKLYHKKGALLRLSNSYGEARKNLEYGIETIVPRLSELNRERITPVFQSEMAQLYNELNQPQKAIDIYKSMIQVAENQENLARISIYNNNCGLAYFRLRDFPKAKYHFQKNYEANLEWKGPKSVGLISSFTNLANVNVHLHNNEEALDYFHKAIDLIIEVLGEGNVRLSDLYFTLGNFHLNHRDLEQALGAFQKIIQIREGKELFKDVETTNAYQMQGAILVMMGKVEEGILSLKKAIENAKSNNLEQNTDLGKSYSFLYDAYVKQGDLQKAKEALDLAFASVNYDFKHPLAFDKVGVPNFLITPFGRLIEYYSLMQKEDPRALMDGEKTIEIAQELMQYLKYNLGAMSSRQVLAEDVRPLNDAIIDFYFQAFEQDQNTSLIEQAFKTIEKNSNTFLYENLAEESKNAYQLPQELIDRRNRILSTISDNKENINTVHSEAQEYNSLLTELNNSHKQLYELIEEIKTDHSEYYTTIYNYPITDIASVQKGLADEEVFISFYFGKEVLHAIKIDNEKVEYEKLGRSDLTKSQVRELIINLKDKGDIDAIRSDVQELYSSIIAPLELGNYRRLFICRDDILSLLPLEVLKNSQTQYGQHQTIAYQYSATLMNTPNSLAKSGYGVLAMAPIFEEGKSESNDAMLFAEAIRGVETVYLPETELEATTIGDLFSGNVFLRSDASKANFKELAYGKSILHLATHGFADQENSNKSCLYFAQSDSTQESGQLFAEEIAQMNINADLVTLSACNTGTGKIQVGEGVASLGRAFAYADCPNQVLSLWSVNDKTTTQLMSYFYTNLKDGQPKATALRNAKTQYLASAPEILKHPYYWAGFVYYGSDSVLNIKSHSGNLLFVGLCGIGLLLAGLFLKTRVG